MPALICPGAVYKPQPGGVTLDTSLPPRGVWHITWDALRPGGIQPAFTAVAGYLMRMQYCPNIMWNPFTGEIWQFYPANVGGRALRYNNQDGKVCIQVEVFFSPGCVVNGKKYMTVAETPCKNWETLIAWMESWGVPRKWPMGSPQWQNNSRSIPIWNANAGHYGHCNSPGDTHTDPGPMPSLARPTAPPVKPPVVVVKPSGGVTKTNYVPDPHWRVDPGDTLGKIAQYYGVTVEKLAAWNGIRNVNDITVGERIWKPGVGHGTWKVEKGDSLARIVAWVKSNWKVTVTEKSLCYANGINDVTKIPVGLRLKIA